jgi:hypothetical protein
VTTICPLVFTVSGSSTPATWSSVWEYPEVDPLAAAAAADCMRSGTAAPNPIAP